MFENLRIGGVSPAVVVGIATLILLPQAVFAAESAVVITDDVNSSSGGVYAGSGQVVTTGNSSESVEIHTETNGLGVQGVVDTEVNGVHHQESFNGSSTSTNGVSINIATSTPAEHIETHVHTTSGNSVHTFKIVPPSRPLSGSSTATAEVDTGIRLSGKSSEPLFRISDFFRHFFDIFHFVI